MDPILEHPLATPQQGAAEARALRLIEHPAIRAARERARIKLVADPVAATLDGRTGLERALDQWTLSLAMRVLNADPWRPQILWNVFNAPRAWFGHVFPGAAVAIDNPDNCNRELCVDGASSYRIRGRFGRMPAEFMIEAVTDFDHYAGVGRTVAALTGPRLEVGPDGRFTITVDNRPADGRPNHLQIEDGVHWIFTRDSLPDWECDFTELAVERIEGPSAPAPQSEAEIIDEIVRCMPVWVASWSGFKDTFLGRPAPNQLLGPNGRPGSWGFLCAGRFAVDDDSAIVITTQTGGAAYTGFQVSDDWTVSPDPVRHLASLNKSQARANPDGSVTYVLATRDPGVHNWIDTVGLSEGWMLLRWQNVPAATDPSVLKPKVELVAFADVDAALPPETPRVDLATRQAQIAARIRGFDRRFRASAVERPSA